MTAEPYGDSGPATEDRVTVTVHLDPSDWSRHLAAETALGLRDDPPWIPPVWFYDETGSKLFDEITHLDEYYPTEAERSILRRHATEIAELTAPRCLVELGSGTSDKTTLLIDALAAHGSLRQVVPLDVSEEVLRSSARTLAALYPSLRVDAVVGDFHRHLDRIPHVDGSTLVAFLGSTIGNLGPGRRARFLHSLAAALRSGDWLLLGTDLVKPVDRLLAAYDDADGVTAAFDLNALHVLNRELGADFDPERFRHRAHWDEADERIEMHLVADGDQRVVIRALDDLVLEVPAGGHLRTEISCKFRQASVRQQLLAAGFDTAAAWTDDAGDFLLTVARRI